MTRLKSSRLAFFSKTEVVPNRFPHLVIHGQIPNVLSHIESEIAFSKDLVHPTPNHVPWTRTFRSSSIRRSRIRPSSSLAPRVICLRKCEKANQYRVVISLRFRPQIPNPHFPCEQPGALADGEPFSNLVLARHSTKRVSGCNGRIPNAQLITDKTAESPLGSSSP